MMQNTRFRMPTIGARMPPMITMVSTMQISIAMVMVIWKFSASLAWSVTKALPASSLLISQMISGPMNQVKMPSRCAARAMVRWSAGASVVAGGGGTLSNSLTTKLLFIGWS
ncbi:hypothetical protein G6F57_013441 [Rhizopus arrhizus]|nr:hypothetical protein G6F57_013441 [Rhizopus arrhizus]